MLYLDTIQAEGCAIYFDLQRIERSSGGYRLAGTVGDGCYEGEVLIEVGSRDEVTFVDEWLRAPGFSKFLQRCDAAQLRVALAQAARSLRMYGCLAERRPQPHSYALADAASGAGRVAEGRAA